VQEQLEPQVQRDQPATPDPAEQADHQGLAVLAGQPVQRDRQVPPVQMSMTLASGFPYSAYLQRLLRHFNASGQ
jgi:hypothetical protein